MPYVLASSLLNAYFLSYTQLTNIDASSRLGAGPTGRAMIQEHAFFSGIGWKNLEDRAVEPPFKPEGSGRDTLNYDPTVTSQSPVVLM